ncbi:MAG: gluconokinase [Streptosporangiaceae bacterium]
MGTAATLIVVVAGVSGSGKSTVGALLAERLHAVFADGDSFHPAANVAKMHAGVPLTDADRQPWLSAIGAWMDDRIAAGDRAVVACSALRRAYRDALLAGRPTARLVFLMVSPEVAAARLAARHGHFFPAGLLDSQFRDLEPPAPDENVLVVDADQPPARLAADIPGLGVPPMRRDG